MIAKTIYTTKLWRRGMVLRRRLLLILFLCISSTIPIFCQNLANSEAGFNLAKELIRTAGPVPDAVIAPPEQVRYELTVGERLRRLWLEKVIGFRISYAAARGKACHGNQRVLAWAVAMYNEEHGNTMKAIVHADVIGATSTLFINKYLKSPLTPADSACEYRSYGDLTGPGIIYCTHHGPNLDIQNSIRKELGLKTVMTENEQLLAVAGLSILFLLMAIALLALFFRRRRKDKCSSTVLES